MVYVLLGRFYQPIILACFFVAFVPDCTTDPRVTESVTGSNAVEHPYKVLPWGKFVTINEMKLLRKQAVPYKMDKNKKNSLYP